MADSVNGSKEPLLTFTIKNPSKHDADAFKLTVPLSATLADIQRRIEAEYDGNPSPQRQTVSPASTVGQSQVGWGGTRLPNCPVYLSPVICS